MQRKRGIEPLPVSEFRVRCRGVTYTLENDSTKTMRYEYNRPSS